MTTEKCWFCLKLETGCLLLGLTTFLLSMTEILSAGLFLNKYGYFDSGVALKTNMSVMHMNISEHDKNKFDLTLSNSAIEVMAGFALIILFLWMVFSVLMMIGVLKKKVNFVMAYFLFGIAISILHLLSGLLEAISGLWALSVVTIVFTLLYIQRLTSVYVAYDNMRQEKASDLEQLILNDDVDDDL